MRIRIHGLLAAILAVAISALVIAQDAVREVTIRTAPRRGPILVAVNGRRVDFPDVEPQMYGDRVMVPMRGVFELMNARVRWSPADRRVVGVTGPVRSCG